MRIKNLGNESLDIRLEEGIMDELNVVDIWEWTYQQMNL